jgi:hypothetical protein
MQHNKTFCLLSTMQRMGRGPSDGFQYKALMRRREPGMGGENLSIGSITILTVSISEGINPAPGREKRAEGAGGETAAGVPSVGRGAAGRADMPGDAGR